MSLSREQYDQIMRGYQACQSRNIYEANRRKREVCALIPEYRKLEDEVASASVERVRLLLDGNGGSLTEYREKIARNAARRTELLRQHNFPADYLEPLYTCPDCKDTGYIDGEKCHCFRQQEITLLYEQSNIQEMLAKENFSVLSYEYYDGEDLNRFQNAVNVSKDFIAGFDTHYQNLFFYGTVGTGKSFLSNCIAGELLASRHSVIYFSANALFEKLSQYVFTTNSKEALYNYYKDLYNCDLVIIDDLGTEVTNSFVASQFFALLNERHLRQKSTIISTNLSLEELQDRYSDRVLSRITSNYSICKLSGQDIRIQRKLSGKLTPKHNNKNTQ